jgi:hypothetical protein
MLKRYGPYLLAGLLGLGAGYFLGANLGRTSEADVGLTECQAERDEAVTSEAALQRQLDDCKAGELR